MLLAMTPEFPDSNLRSHIRGKPFDSLFVGYETFISARASLKPPVTSLSLQDRDGKNMRTYMCPHYWAHHRDIGMTFWGYGIEALCECLSLLRSSGILYR
jgi:hypothetical protein